MTAPLSELLDGVPGPPGRRLEVARSHQAIARRGVPVDVQLARALLPIFKLQSS